MSSQGPNGGANAVSNGVGDQPWINPDSSNGSDDTYATCTLPALDETSEGLETTDCGFSLSSTDTVDGIVVLIERHEGLGNIIDFAIQLIKGGTASGNNKASVSEWPSSDAVATYGSASDKWGLSWAYSDINASNFGVLVRAANSGGVLSIANIDDISITVYYTTASGVKQLATLGVG